MKDEFHLIHINTPVAAEAPIKSLSAMEEAWTEEDKDAFADLVAHKVLELLLSNTNIKPVVIKDETI